MGQEVYTSFESAVYLTDKKTFSISPKPIPTDKRNPYKVLDQKETKVKFLINDRSGAEKQWAQANISLPEMDTLLNAVNAAQVGLLHNYQFPTQTKIFGQPDANGYMIVSKFSVSRMELGKDGEKRNFPWFISIERGKGKGKSGKYQGSVYLDGSSYIKEVGVFVNLTDADFKSMLFWTKHLFEVFIGATRKSIIEGYSEYKKAKGSS